MWGTVLCLILLVSYVYKWWRKQPKTKFLPPGPPSYPIIGSPVIGKHPHILPAFQHLHKEYGPIFKVGLGPYKAIVIGDYEMLKDLFKLDVTTDRPQMMQWANAYFRFGNGRDSRGLLFSESEEWKEQRRFTLRVLKDFGFGKSSMEILIHDEVQAFNSSLRLDCGKSLNMRHRFNISVINGLWTLISGKRLALDDPALIHLVEIIDELTIESGKQKIIDAFPWVRHIAPKASGWEKAMADVTKLVDFIEDTMNPHIKSYNPEDNPNDYIEAYLQHMAMSKPGSSFHGKRGVQSLRASLLDLMFAGAETTSTVMNWSMLLLIKYPDVQKRVQEELDSVCGTERLPSLKDRQHLHYTDAVINEILRYTCIAPFGVPHYTRQDVWTSDKKYLIPAGTNIFPNFHQITHNSEVFDDPFAFRPERFLDENNHFIKHEHNIVFGIGKRDCLGKSLAISQYYLFLTGIVQQFRLRSPLENLEDLSIEPKLGFTLSPQSFEVIAESRL